MPSAKILEQKQQMVAELAEKMKNAKSGVIVDYCGITVEKDTALRAELRKAGVDYKVIKNTYIHKAADIAGRTDVKVLASFSPVAKAWIRTLTV